MPKIPGNLARAIENLRQYPTLSAAIDHSRFERAVTKKYSNGPELLDGEVWDLYTALLISTHDMFKQEGQNQATLEGVLFSIDQVISELGLSPPDRDRLGIKLCNLRTSSLWDTLSELLLASRLRGALPGRSIRVDYPLDPTAPTGNGKDADVAILGPNGDAMLIDSVAPQPIDGTQSVRDELVAWISRKYQTKFSSFCSQNPQATVAVVVSLIKNEIFYLGFPMKVAAGHVANLTSPQLDALPSLVLAHACTFRCPSGRRLVLDPIATYSRVPASSS